MANLLPRYSVLIESVTNGQANGMLFCPASVNSTADRPYRNIAERNPVRREAGFPERGNWLVVAFISRLLFWRCPPSIARLVIPVFVGIAIERASFRRLANITRENGGIMPRLANFDAAPAIVAIFTAFMVVATLHHACPCLINSRAAQPVPETFGLAPAISGPSAAKQGRSCKVRLTASANAFPHDRAADPLVGGPNRGQQAKGLACNVQLELGPLAAAETPATAYPAADKNRGRRKVWIAASAQTFPHHATIAPLTCRSDSRQKAELFCGNIRDVHLVISGNLMLGADGVFALSWPRITMRSIS